MIAFRFFQALILIASFSPAFAGEKKGAERFVGKNWFEIRPAKCEGEENLIGEPHETRSAAVYTESGKSYFLLMEGHFFGVPTKGARSNIVAAVDLGTLDPKTELVASISRSEVYCTRHLAGPGTELFLAVVKTSGSGIESVPVRAWAWNEGNKKFVPVTKQSELNRFSCETDQAGDMDPDVWAKDLPRLYGPGRCVRQTQAKRN